MNWLRYFLVAVIAYLLGNFSTGVVVSKAFAHTDIRTQGSGNAGRHQRTAHLRLAAVGTDAGGRRAEGHHRRAAGRALPGIRHADCRRGHGDRPQLAGVLSLQGRQGHRPVPWASSLFPAPGSPWRWWRSRSSSRPLPATCPWPPSSRGCSIPPSRAIFHPHNTGLSSPPR